VKQQEEAKREELRREKERLEQEEKKRFELAERVNYHLFVNHHHGKIRMIIYQFSHYYW